MGQAAIASVATLAGRSGQAEAALPTPHDVGRKLHPDGRVRRFPGNTFIHHLAQQGDGFEFFNELLNLYREAPRHAFARKIAWTPPSSYHMTVFAGFNEEDRGTPKSPSAVAAGRSLEEITAQWLEQFRTGLDITSTRVRMKFGTAAYTEGGSPHIPLVPADESSRRVLAQLRDALSALTGIRGSDHERYEFHITYGYVFHWLSRTEAQALQGFTEYWTRQLEKRFGMLEIDGVQFCSFEDMYAFRVLHELKK